MRKIIPVPEMTHPVQIQNFKISVDKDLLNQFLTSKSPEIKNTIDFIGAEAKISPKHISWIPREKLSPEIETIVNIRIENPDWNFSSTAHLSMIPQRIQSPFRWKDFDSKFIPSFRLGEHSDFRIDEHIIKLTPTVNALLLNKKEEIAQIVKEGIINQTRTISNQYLGNDLLVDILKSSYFWFSTSGSAKDLNFSLSLSPDNVHSDQIIRGQSQIKIDLPKENLFHLLQKIPFPVLSAMGYNLHVSKVEPIGINRLKVNLLDDIKNLKIDLITEVILSDNVIGLKISDLDIRGMGWLKSGIFRMLKTTIIRKIEKRKIPISDLYHSLIFELTKKYPFLRVQENQELQVSHLEISPGGFSALLNF